MIYYGIDFYAQTFKNKKIHAIGKPNSEYCDLYEKWAEI